MNIYRRLLLASLGVLCFASAWADCETRAPTVKEIEFHKSIFAALQSALAPAPEKWTLEVKPEQKPIGGCVGEAEGRFSITLNASYTYHPTKEEGDRLYAEYRKLEKDKDNLTQLPPAIAKERQEWLDKMSVANRASNQAYKDGNKQLSHQKDNEAQEYSDKGKEVRNKYVASIQPQIEEIEAKQKQIAYKDSGVLVKIVVNERYGEGDPFTPKDDTEVKFGKAKTPDHPGLKAHALRLKLTGRIAQRAVVEGLIDKGKLASIVQ
jgi:hypothetical protein